ncbi:MAG: bifunctional adenosylcobinamide kinase/adenosylcobinamide-phosphate guanylyltransferase [Eubacteriales bacterium]|nr:bifunctional adenosylcobinamide kinase/adenosylcobinamide-phosphate guanylyltransferase [Eubacteriales bacterium]
MKLVIGGCNQGKLDYVMEALGSEDSIVYNGAAFTCNVNPPEGTVVVVNRLHLFVRECLMRDGDPEKEMDAFVERFPDCIIISDEVGNGIVPVDKFERKWREKTGRLLTHLARNATEVTRVFCGIGQKIK